MTGNWQLVLGPGSVCFFALFGELRAGRDLGVHVLARPSGITPQFGSNAAGPVIFAERAKMIDLLAIIDGWIGRRMASEAGMG